jgi:predicted AlkP superfamily phosphohydrolase/phosphomutase/tetratricopeptide (TPR) repeat protein
MSDSARSKILLVGWDAADWKHIRPLLAAGLLPTLAELIKGGVYGNLATLRPILSPMLWNSIATGKRPHKHGILGFTEPTPDGSGVRPSTSTTRRTKAFWNMLSQEGLRTNVVGWFCSHPAEPIRGASVSNLYHRVDLVEPLKALPAGAVHPETLVDELAELRLHPTEMEPAHVVPFLPSAADIDQEKDRRLGTLVKLLTECTNVHSAATHLMLNTEWDVTAVYYDAIDHFCHAFMEYHPPKMPQVSDEDFEIYQHVITGCYRFHDMMLQRLLEIAGEDTTVILCSDHGFHSDHLRPRVTPREPAGPAAWHREYGILVINGPGLQQNHQVCGASLLDIAPTLLTLAGLPVGRDMDGKVLVNAWEKMPTIERIDSWDDVPGESGQHPQDHHEDPFEARQALEQLVALGYIEPIGKDVKRAADRAEREAQYNLARSYLDAGMIDEAIDSLNLLAEANPDDMRFPLNLTNCLLKRKRLDEARVQIDRVFKLAEHQSQSDIEALELRRTLLADDDVEPVSDDDSELERDGGLRAHVAEIKRDLSAEQLGDLQADLTREIERRREYEVRVAPHAQLLLGTLEFYSGNDEQAQKHLLQAETADPRMPGLHHQLGQVYLRMRRWEDALRAFQKALNIDGDSTHAHAGLAATLLRLGRPNDAADQALQAVELQQHFPRAHFLLGIALARLNLYGRAVEAFKETIRQSPGMIQAHRWIARIYSRHLLQPELAARHIQLAKQLRAGRRAARTANDTN